MLEEKKRNQIYANSFIVFCVLILVVGSFYLGFNPTEPKEKKIVKNTKVVKEINKEDVLHLNQSDNAFKKIEIKNSANLTLNISEIRTGQVNGNIKQLYKTYSGCTDTFVFHSRCN